MLTWLRESGVLNWAIRIGPILVLIVIIGWASIGEENGDEHEEV
jgi:hypothetical protein